MIGADHEPGPGRSPMPRATGPFWPLVAVWLLVIGAWLVVRPGPWSAAVPAALGALTAGLLVWRGMRSPPTTRRVLLMLGCSQTLLSLGDVALAFAGDDGGGSGYADAAYMGSYPMVAAAVAALMWARVGRRMLSSLVDSLMVGMLACAFIWLTLMATPGAGEVSQWLVAAAYPSMDALMLAAVAWLLLSPGARGPLAYLLAANLTAEVAVDIAYAYNVSHAASGDTPALNLMYAVSYLPLAFLARHPDVHLTPAPEPAVEESTATPTLLVVLGIGIISTPLLALTARQTGQLPAVTGALTLLSAVMVVRMTMIVRAANRDRALARESLRELDYRTNNDPLTGMLNRSGLVTQLGRRLGGDDGALTVFHIDLDDFKTVNDSLGHDLGDRLLRQSAYRLAAAAPSDSILARLGGDEFAMVTSGASAGSAVDLARTLLDTLRTPMPLDDRELFMNASIGIALADAGGADTAEDLLQAADIAMHGAKDAGRGQWQVFGGAMRHRVAERHSLETDLRRAVNDGAIGVVYQPQVDMRTGAVVGVEALARWKHPDRGEVSPAVFIPLAESSGLILDLGELVLRRACADAHRWNMSLDVPLTVAVNVSARQFTQSGIVGLVRQALAASRLPAQRLALELTETALAVDPAGVRKRMDVLRAMGVRVELDDFGTGQSSLAALRSFPLDVVKIDRGFMAGVGTDPQATASLAAVLGLIEALGLEAVAEGVETLEQGTALQSMPCGRAQGFLYGRPMQVEDIDMMLRHMGARALPRL